MRAVLDANVLASAFIQPRGPSGKVLERFASDRAFEIVLSLPILEELERILEYPRVRRHLRTPADEIEARLAALAILADVVEPRMRVQAVPNDPDDNRYVEAALEGRASHIVSGDRHLLDVGEYPSVRIVTPRIFLEIFEAERGGAGPGEARG